MEQELELEQEYKQEQIVIKNASKNFIDYYIQSNIDMFKKLDEQNLNDEQKKIIKQINDLNNELSILCNKLNSNNDNKNNNLEILNNDVCPNVAEPKLLSSEKIDDFKSSEKIDDFKSSEKSNTNTITEHTYFNENDFNADEDSDEYFDYNKTMNINDESSDETAEELIYNDVDKNDVLSKEDEKSVNDTLNILKNFGLNIPKKDIEKKIKKLNR